MKQYLATVLNLTAVYNLSSGKFGHCDIIVFSTGIFCGSRHAAATTATTGTFALRDF